MLLFQPNLVIHHQFIAKHGGMQSMIFPLGAFLSDASNPRSWNLIVDNIHFISILIVISHKRADSFSYAKSNKKEYT